MDLLNTRDAAKELGLGERTLEAWRCRGEGPPFFKLGSRRVAYSREDLESWVLSRKQDPVRRSVGVKPRPHHLGW